MKINVLMMDYRGYGASAGVPSEKGLNKDADAVIKYAAAHPKLRRSKLVVFGRSLGGAVCFSAAQRNPTLVSAVVVENTFGSIPAMVDVLLPYLSAIKVIYTPLSSHLPSCIVVPFKITKPPFPLMFWVSGKKSAVSERNVSTSGF